MPFTISHAAVVLPFARLLMRWRLLSACIIGAMVPDFGLFFPWRIHRFETHSTLAGYVPESLEKSTAPRMTERTIDVGYRGRELPYWLGTLGQEKTVPPTAQ